MFRRVMMHEVSLLGVGSIFDQESRFSGPLVREGILARLRLYLMSERLMTTWIMST
jgi:hypothetical protein